MEKQTQTVYTLVDVRDQVFGKQYAVILNPEIKILSALEKQTEVYVFTKKELEELKRSIASEAYRAGLHSTIGT